MSNVFAHGNRRSNFQVGPALSRHGTGYVSPACATCGDEDAFIPQQFHASSSRGTQPPQVASDSSAAVHGSPVSRNSMYMDSILYYTSYERPHEIRVISERRVPDAAMGIIRRLFSKRSSSPHWSGKLLFHAAIGLGSSGSCAQQLKQQEKVSHMSLESICLHLLGAKE